MIFEITKPITATLRVDCNSEEDAINWANKIVATIEDENGNFISPDDVDYFDAETITSEIKIIKTSIR